MSYFLLPGLPVTADSCGTVEKGLDDSILDGRGVV